MSELGRALATTVGRLALWLMPLTIIFEWVGGFFQKTLPARLLYLGLFLGLFWLSDLTPVRSVGSGVTRRIGGALCLLVGIAALSLAFVAELGGHFGWAPPPFPSWLDTDARRLLLPLLAAWPLAIGGALLQAPGRSARAYERLGMWIALGFLVHIAANIHVQSLPIVRADPWSQRLVIGEAVLLFALVLMPRGSPLLRLGLLLAGGFALRVDGILAWQIDPRVRDMLALVQSAQDRFAEGRHPYAIYAMQHGSELPLTYLPGLWLGYGLPRLAGLDLRFMGPLAEVCLFALLGVTARRLEQPRRAWGEAWVNCFAAVWLFSPSVQWNAIYAEPTLWWSLLGIALTLAFSWRFSGAALALGYAMATRHFALVLAPFALLYFVRARGLRGSLPYVALALLVAVALLTAFVAPDPELFWFGTLRWLREYGPAHLNWFFDRFGFMQMFHERDAMAWLPVAQWGAVGLCFLGALLSRNLTLVPRYTATALLLFIMFNVLLWDSFLLDGAIAAACVVLTRAWSERPIVAVNPSPRVFRSAQFGLAAATIAGCYLAWSLIGSLRPSGRAEAHDFAVASIKPADNVIDRSDRRIAFVEGSWLLRHEEVHTPIGGELYDLAWGGGPALHAKGDVWLITQHARDEALRRAFSGLGTPRVSRHFGGYDVQAITPRAMQVARALPDHPGVSLRRCPLFPTQWDLLAVEVSADKPARVTFEPQALGDALMLSAGFPDHDVFWPHQRVTLALDAGQQTPLPFELDNLHGMQWTSFTTPELSGHERALSLELRTRDVVPRIVCLELLILRDRAP